MTGDKKLSKRATPCPTILWAETNDTTRRGHGVEFLHNDPPLTVVVFAKEFDWLHNPGTPVTVEVLTTPPSGVSVQVWQEILRETRDAVVLFFNGSAKLDFNFTRGPVSISVNG